jgi:hypothetical protein
MSLLSYRDWLSLCASPKDYSEHLAYSESMWDSAKSGLGCNFNRHLNHSIESISVNVGDSRQNGNESSPQRSVVRVGAVIVVGGWESQPQGEGR